jgi:hypothetical protein
VLDVPVPAAVRTLIDAEFETVIAVLLKALPVLACITRAALAALFANPLA